MEAQQSFCTIGLVLCALARPDVSYVRTWPGSPCKRVNEVRQFDGSSAAEPGATTFTGTKGSDGKGEAAKQRAAFDKPQKALAETSPIVCKYKQRKLERAPEGKIRAMRNEVAQCTTLEVHTSTPHDDALDYRRTTRRQYCTIYTWPAISAHSLSHSEGTIHHYRTCNVCPLAFRQLSAQAAKSVQKEITPLEWLPRGQSEMAARSL
eukprot:1141287-Pelagomonas_calceolata.AAC.6